MYNARINKAYVCLKMKTAGSCSFEVYLDKAIPIPNSVFEAAGKVKTIDKTPSDFRLFENQLAFAQNT